jgi:hypothetical protein
MELVLALISLDISTVPLCYSSTSKIAAKHDHFGYEIVFDAVVKDLL